MHNRKKTTFRHTFVFNSKSFLYLHGKISQDIIPTFVIIHTKS